MERKPQGRLSQGTTSSGPRPHGVPSESGAGESRRPSLRGPPGVPGEALIPALPPAPEEGRARPTQGSAGSWADRRPAPRTGRRTGGAGTCEVSGQCHLISQQVSLSYEVSLQFALAPLGGGLLKQRDRLGEGRQGEGGAERQEGVGRETETQILNTESQRPHRGDRHAAAPAGGGQPPTAGSQD